MDNRGLHTLEFPKVIHMLEKKASTIVGKDLSKSLAPKSKLEEVIYAQQETSEAMEVLRLKGGLPLGGIKDIRPAIKRLKIGGVLTPEQFIDISSTIFSGRRLKRFITNVNEEFELPILFSHGEGITDLRDLEDNINSRINEFGEILDSASSELRSIRQQLRILDGRVKEKLDQILRNHSNQKMLMDAIVTIRNGRYVIPVKQEYRGNFGGIIHDQSASGATLFIEPEVVVQINNQLKELKLKEEKEIERILRNLSDLAREELEALEINIEHLGIVDFIQAKADLATEMKAIKPRINDRGYIRMKKARHPLIPMVDVVPIDVHLGDEFTTIVITGPNTGGKTVSLKTIGLLTLMGMAGLHIPAEDGSELSIFSAIYADIGDEQSIEQSLSTFSSHLTNIIRILGNMDEKSLILLDELGAGTDPTEGAALAISILEKLRLIGARVVATTHYSELKAYAYNREDVMNASVEFDVYTLRPTYRLLIGVPGRSNAFAIAKRLGLPEEIIEFAKNQISDENLQVESMIETLEFSQRTAEKERVTAESLRKEAQKLNKELEEKVEDFEREKQRLLEQAMNEADKIINKAKKEAEEVIADLRRLAKEEQAGIKEHKLIEMKKRLEDAVPDQTKTISKKHKKAEKIELGDEVKVLTLGQKGVVIEIIDSKEFLVQIGIIKMKVEKENLQLLETKKNPVKQVNFTSVNRESGVKPEVDVRGHNVEDAILKIDHYLDNAFMEGYKLVYIIHGKGTGALRTGLQEFLRNHPHIKTTRMGQMNEGGLGVTVAELK